MTTADLASCGGRDASAPRPRRAVAIFEGAGIEAAPDARRGAELGRDAVLVRAGLVMDDRRVLTDVLLDGGSTSG
jgi:hypothetical protein